LVPVTTVEIGDGM
jgi:hypothetical protein